jgi:hypothetical protein
MHINIRLDDGMIVHADLAPGYTPEDVTPEERAILKEFVQSARDKGRRIQGAPRQSRFTGRQVFNVPRGTSMA